MVIYLYTHSFAGAVRYVGIGTSSRPFNFTSRNAYWKALRKKHGNPDVEFLGAFLTREDACAAEVALIALLRSEGAKLANLTSGGDAGTTLSPETRAKMSAAHLSRDRSDHALRAVSERSRAAWADPVQRERMVVAIRSRTRAPEERERARKRNTETWADPTRRAQMSETLSTYWSDPTRRAQMSETKKTLMRTEEKRAQMSALARAQHADPESRARYLAGRGTPVRCIDLGLEFKTVVDAAAFVREPASRLRAHLLNGRKDFGGMSWEYVKKKP